MNSEQVLNMLKEVTVARVPLFNDYKASEEARVREMRKKDKHRDPNSEEDDEDLAEKSPELPTNGCQEILEHVIFNIMQEFANSFEPNEVPRKLDPVQPRELVDVKTYRSSFL